MQARVEVADYAQKFNSIVDSVSREGQDDMIVADLVSSFLIPEVEREIVREQSKGFVFSFCFYRSEQ